MDSIIKSLLHHQAIGTEYIEKYDKARKEADALQVVIKHMILAFKDGYLTEQLIEAFLDLPQIPDQAIKYIYDNNRTTIKGD
jgi:hypothetical protein